MRRCCILGSLLGIAGLLIISPTGAAPAQKKASPQSSPRTVAYLAEKIGDALWTRNDYCFHKGRWNDSIRICMALIKAEPTFLNAYQDAGFMLSNLGRKAEALTVYKQGLAAIPNRYDMYFEIARAFYLLDRKFREALPYLEKAVTFKEADVNVWKQLAHTYRELKMYDKSIATWKKIKQKFPNEPVTDNNLKKVQEEAAHQRL